MYVKIIALLAVVFGTIGRVKYLLQGTKIRRRQSSADVSGGFYILTTIGYILMFLHCLNIKDWVGIIFWGVGLATTTYCLICVYLYWNIPFKKFLWVSVKEIYSDTITTFKKHGRK